MAIDIFSEINFRYESLTKAEKKVADYVLEHSKEVMYMSITDLAYECKVADSSVFRFCKSMDLRGYQDLKIALAHNTASDNNGIAHIEDKINIKDSLREITNKLLTTNIDALNQTYSLINEDDIVRAVDSLINCDRFYFLGVGSSLVTALEGKNKFMRITNKAEVLADTHLQVMAASLMTERDVAIMISYSGSTKDTIEVARMAKERGAKVISITRFAKSPLTSYSDITLLCGSNEGPLQGGSMSAKMSQLYLLDILYAEYFKRTESKSKSNKELTAKSVVDKMI